MTFWISTSIYIKKPTTCSLCATSKPSIPTKTVGSFVHASWRGGKWLTGSHIIRRPSQASAWRHHSFALYNQETP